MIGGLSPESRLRKWISISLSVLVLVPCEISSSNIVDGKKTSTGRVFWSLGHSIILKEERKWKWNLLIYLDVSEWRCPIYLIPCPLHLLHLHTWHTIQSHKSHKKIDHCFNNFWFSTIKCAITRYPVQT